MPVPRRARLVTRVVLGLALCRLAGGCAHPPAAGPARAQSADTPALHRLFDQYYEDLLALDPLLATTLGDHRYDARLANDLGEGHRANVAALCRRTLDQLQAFPPASLDDGDRLSHELLRRELVDRLKGLAFPEHLLALTQLSGQPVDFPVMGSGAGVHPFETAADYRNFLGRARDFATWMDTAIGNLRRGIAAGVVHPSIVIEALLPQLDAQIVDDPARSIFFEPVGRWGARVPPAERPTLEAAFRDSIARVIVPAYRRLRAFLADEYLPRCRASVAFEALPDGAAWYAHRVRASTTTRLSPDQIFQMGEAEVARLEAAMLALRDRAGWKGDLASFARSLTEAPGRLTTRAALVAAYDGLRVQVERALPQFFGRLPRARFEVRPIEPYREDSAPSQYQQPSPDGTRPGIFFVNTADVGKGRSMRASATLFLHEAMPGHHLQIALQYEDTTLPRFRRTLSYAAFEEGWALYAESLGDELGVFTEPAQALDHLGAEMLRAVRLVVDTGLHHRGWTRDQAVAYYRAHVISTTEDVASDSVREVNRYIAWPGQALAYKVGQLKIAELRRRAAAALGPRFDLRAFHDEVLRNGPLPLDLLETRIDAWIAAAQRSGAPSGPRIEKNSQGGSSIPGRPVVGQSHVLVGGPPFFNPG
jgi:uncharacterized protein (DUF885 family)